MSEQQLANNLCQEIDNCLEKLKGNDTAKRRALEKGMDQLNITSAVLPIIVTFVSGYAYLVTQQVATLLLSLVDVIPPYLIKSSKDQMKFYNTCVDLELKFSGLKSDVNSLALLSELKNNYNTMKERLDGLKDTLRTALQLQV
jgi:hypothetical protein